MSYYFSKISELDFDSTINKIQENIQNYGFGIISEIDVTATFKKKLNADFRKYRILGACHAPSAFKAISIENKIGTMLPCNIIVQELEDGKIEVSAVDPIQSMMAVQNEQLGAVASEVRDNLKKFIDEF